MASPLNVAAPLASVVAVALLSVAPAGPEAITAVTARSAPPAGLPAPSRTWSTGCGLNGAPLPAVGDGWVVIVSCVAVPAPSVIVPEVAGVRGPLSNRSVYVPTGPLSVSSLNVAAPPATVVAVAFVSVAPVGPEAITAVTGTPPPPAGWPPRAPTWSTRCGLHGVPRPALADRSLVSAGRVAVPAPSVIVPDVAALRGPLSNRSV